MAMKQTANKPAPAKAAQTATKPSPLVGAASNKGPAPPSTAVATRQPPQDQAVSEQLFGADAGAGFDEGVDAGAFAIPFLMIVQALSPVAQAGKPEFIEEARPGMMINSLTKALMKTVDVSVVRRTHTFCVWHKREDGGGFISEYEATTDAVLEFQGLEVDEKNRRINKDGHQVTEHRNFYCQIIDEATGSASEPLLVSMSNSQLKPAREWNSLISLRSARVGETKAPVAPSEIWRLGTVLKTKGENSWFMYTVNHVTRHSNPALYAEVRAAIPVAKEMKALVRPRTDDEDATEGEGGEV